MHSTPYLALIGLVRAFAELFLILVADRGHDRGKVSLRHTSSIPRERLMFGQFLVELEVDGDPVFEFVAVQRIEDDELYWFGIHTGGTQLGEVGGAKHDRRYLPSLLGIELEVAPQDEVLVRQACSRVPP